MPTPLKLSPGPEQSGSQSGIQGHEMPPASVPQPHIFTKRHHSNSRSSGRSCTVDLLLDQHLRRRSNIEPHLDYV